MWIECHLSIESSGFVAGFWPTEPISLRKYQILTVDLTRLFLHSIFHIDQFNGECFSSISSRCWTRRCQFSSTINWKWNRFGNAWRSQMKSIEKTSKDDFLRFQDEQTALILAARCNHLELVRILLEAKANVNAHDVVRSISKKKKQMIFFRFFFLSEKDHWTALLNASHNGNFDMVKILVENDAQLEHFDCVNRLNSIEFSSLNHSL